MEIVGDISALDRTAPIAFVPTMGALHSGHAELIRRARTYTSNVLVSVFVNPLQFDNADDLKKYPRTPELDAHIAEAAGASTVWFPQMSTLFLEDFKKIPSPALGESFEGAHRPSHFSGVLSVVSALFDAAKPRWAIFGEKDFQQLFLIRQMVSQLNLEIEIVGVATVRDEDGLAISSRNSRLNLEDRRIALVASRALRRAAQEPDLARAKAVLTKSFSEEPRFALDYAVIVDEETLALANEQTGTKRALVAGWVGDVRLIDNMAMQVAANDVKD